MILVTGATGLVGAHLMHALLQTHETIRATHRDSSDLESVKEVFSCYGASANELYERIEWIAADITKIPELTIAFAQITQVYHCAAFISFDPKHYYKLKKANIEGTANIVNLCLSHQVKKLCHVSTIATLSSTLDGSPANEEDHWNPEENNNVYAITKYGAEMEVWRGIQEGLDSVIVNPGVILGEGYWHSGSGVIPKRAAKGGAYYPPGASGFVDVKDVVKVMVLLMKSDVTNERFILVAENLPFKKLLHLFAEQFGKKAPHKTVSKKGLIFLSALDKVSSILLRSKRKLLKPMVESMYTVSKYDASKVSRLLAFKFRPIEDTIARVSKAYSSISSTD